MAEPVRTDEVQGEIVHVYDGIEEADNQLPRWWLGTFVITIAFSAAYWFVFHMFQISPHPLPAYLQAQMEAMDKGGPVTDEEIDALAADARMVSAGQALFVANCASCHLADGSGKIGPNLTDDAWLHGGAPSAIYTTIAKGIDGKGMQAWKPSLGGGAVKQLSAFVVSIRNTNRPGREPQGERWVPAPAASAAAPAGAAAGEPGGATGAATGTAATGG